MNYIILAVLIADFILYKVISKKLAQKSSDFKYKRFHYIKKTSEDTELNRLIRWHNIHLTGFIAFVVIVLIIQVNKWISV